MTTDNWPWDALIQGWQVGAWRDQVIWVVPMIFNNRVVIGYPEHMGYEHGWCYDKGAAAFLAAAAWDPETEDEPAGYKKRATPGHRRAPRKVEA